MPDDLRVPAVLGDVASGVDLVTVAGVTSIASTVLWAIPVHDRLDQAGRSRAAMDGLLRANLLRRLALTGSTLALAWSVWRSSCGPGGARA